MLERNPTGPWIQTGSGIAFEFLNPTADMIDIGDIMMSLTRIPRYLGHTQGVITVAQHSVNVMHRVAETLPEAALAALLHDAHEAYIGDIPGPLKKLPAVKAAIDPIEDGIQRAIHTRFGVPHPLPPEWAQAIKDADRWALAVESIILHSIDPAEWGMATPDMPAEFKLMDEDEAWWAFVDAYEALTGDRVA